MIAKRHKQSMPSRHHQFCVRHDCPHLHCQFMSSWAQTVLVEMCSHSNDTDGYSAWCFRVTQLHGSDVVSSQTLLYRSVHCIMSIVPPRDPAGLQQLLECAFCLSTALAA